MGRPGDPLRGAGVARGDDVVKEGCEAGGSELAAEVREDASP